MESHSYKFSAREVLRLLLPILLVNCAFAAVMHTGAKLKLFPSPRAALDIDRAILFHQADAARANQGATVLLIGDSSCLMDISAQTLRARIGASTLNLGTFSYLGLRDYAKLLQARYANSSHRNETILLLMHPEALRRPAPDARYGRILSDYLSGMDHCETATLYHRLCCGLGLEIVRGRFLSRLLPQPLRDRYGESYGFTTGLENHLTEQGGSLLDVEPKAFSGNAEYRLADSLQLQSRAFRAALPRGTRLWVGITPVPATFAPAGYSEHYQEMLKQLHEWLEADFALTNLPPTLPDRLFSKVTHLNAEGVPIYTEQLARTIAPHPLNAR
jgi:hypothetical protein